MAWGYFKKLVLADGLFPFMLIRYITIYLLFKGFSLLLLAFLCPTAFLSDFFWLYGY